LELEQGEGRGNDRISLGFPRKRSQSVQACSPWTLSAEVDTGAPSPGTPLAKETRVADLAAERQ